MFVESIYQLYCLITIIVLYLPKSLPLCFSWSFLGDAFAANIEATELAGLHCLPPGHKSPAGVTVIIWGLRWYIRYHLMAAVIIILLTVILTVNNYY